MFSTPSLNSESPRWSPVDAVKVKMDALCQSIYQNCRLYTEAEKGHVTQDEVGLYLYNILYLIRYTPVHLAMALQRSRELGDAHLIDFFEDKIGEEDGHDQWALADLAKLEAAKMTDEKSPYHVCPSLHGLVKYLAELIQRNPGAYIGYILFVEYFTVKVGPIWTQNLIQKCGIPAETLTVITNHIELDKDHVEDGLKIINDVVSASPGAAAFPHLVDCIETGARYLEGFVREVGEAYRV